MLPQFELQAKRRMHAKRRREQQRQKLALLVCSVTCLLAMLIFFNVYYIYRNNPAPGDYADNVKGSGGGSSGSNVRRRGPWIGKDAQPFVSIAQDKYLVFFRPERYFALIETMFAFSLLFL